MKFGRLIILILLLSACATKKKEMVNPPTSGAPIVPLGLGNDAANSYSQAVLRGTPEIRAQSPSAALSGTIFLKADMPFPLSMVKLQLNKIDKNKVEKILDFTTDRDGTFIITRPLEKGQYQLLVTDSRYKGEFKIPLDTRLNGLVFEVEKISSK